MTISVYNEWDPLKEVLVGDMREDRLPHWSPDWGRYHGCKECLDEFGGQYHLDALPERTQGTIKQTDTLADKLQSLGVAVHRPKLLSKEINNIEPVGTWVQFARDSHLVIGNTVIETNLRMTSRNKEHLAWTEFWCDKTLNDPNVHYMKMPDTSPILTGKTPKDFVSDPRLFLEGGDTFILNNDILVGFSSFASSPNGIRWLQHHLGNNWQVHTVQLKPEWLHLDCVFAVVREGLAICNLDALADGKLPDIIANWDIIPASAEECLAMGSNTVCLEPNVILIGAEHTRLIKEVEKKNGHCIPIPFDKPSEWGGGIRCSTHPVVRDSK